MEFVQSFATSLPLTLTWYLGLIAVMVLLFQAPAAEKVLKQLRNA